MIVTKKNPIFFLISKQFLIIQKNINSSWNMQSVTNRQAGWPSCGLASGRAGRHFFTRENSPAKILNDKKKIFCRKIRAKIKSNQSRRVIFFRKEKKKKSWKDLKFLSGYLTRRRICFKLFSISPQSFFTTQSNICVQSRECLGLSNGAITLSITIKNVTLSITIKKAVLSMTTLRLSYFFFK